jgi:hypothetical protein
MDKSNSGWQQIGYFDVDNWGAFDHHQPHDSEKGLSLGDYFVGLYYKTSDDISQCLAGIAMTFVEDKPPLTKDFRLSSGNSINDTPVTYPGKMIVKWDVDPGGGTSAIDETSSANWGALYALDSDSSHGSVLAAVGLAGTNDSGPILESNVPTGWSRVATFDVSPGGGLGNMGCGQDLNQGSDNCGSYDYSLYQMRVGEKAETQSARDWVAIGNPDKAGNSYTAGLSITDESSWSSTTSYTVSASYETNEVVAKETLSESFTQAVTVAGSHTRGTTESSTTSCEKTFSGSDKVVWQYKYSTTHSGASISSYGMCYYACSSSAATKPNFNPWDTEYSTKAQASCQ